MKRFSVLVKPTGAICNLDCDYCYFLSKERLYPDSRFRMTDAVLDSYVEQLLSSQPETATIAWQGGEPTMMGLDFYRRSIAAVERHRRPDQQVGYSIQTNATLIDDDWASFFREHRFLVGVSIDGPRLLHDAYRTDKRGKGTFDRVIAGYETLRRHDVDVNVLCAVHAANQAHPLDVYRFLRNELGAEFIQFIPIVERVTEAHLPLANLGWGPERPLQVQTGDQVTDRSVTAEGYGRFLTTVFDEWFSHDIGRVYVQHFDVALASWHGVAGGLCIFDETCGTALALEHNGDLYSCDHYVEPEYLLGNIGATPVAALAGSESQRQFGAAKVESLPEYCRSCEVRFACNGGCPKNRLTTTPDGEEGLNYLCAGYKMFFTHVGRPMRVMSDLLNRGLAPALAAEIMNGKPIAGY